MNRLTATKSKSRPEPVWPTDHELALMGWDLAFYSWKLNDAYTRFRRACEELSGCDLSDWGLETLETYFELAKATYDSELTS